MDFALKKIINICSIHGGPRKIIKAMHPLRTGYTAITESDPLHESILQPHSEAHDGQHTHITSEAPVTLDELRCMLEQFESISQLTNSERENLVKASKERIFPHLQYGKAVNWHGKDYPTSRRELEQFDRNDFNPHAPVLGVDPKSIVEAYRQHLEQYSSEVQTVRNRAYDTLCSNHFFCRNQAQLEYLRQLGYSSLESLRTGFSYELFVQAAIYSGFVREKAARNMLSLSLTLFVLYYKFSAIQLIMNTGFILLNCFASNKIKSFSQSALLVFAFCNSTDVVNMFFSMIAAETGKYAVNKTTHLFFSLPSNAKNSDKKAGNALASGVQPN
ncbi:MAG: hypothetical protein NTU49_11255 [Gammaproteobacteria bacterium]|nr:hypothetical protein [Gammaproteobacteria bacterium]